MKGKFSVKLLVFKGHDQTSVQLKESTVDIKETHKVTHSDMVNIGGNDQFISHLDLEASYNYYNSFHNNDLYFQVQYNEDKFSRDIYTLYDQLSTHKLSLQHALVPLHLSHSNEKVNNQVAPVILQLSRFSSMVVGDTWYSSSFFAFIGGYQVCLKVVRLKDCLVS